MNTTMGIKEFAFLNSIKTYDNGRHVGFKSPWIGYNGRLIWNDWEEAIDYLVDTEIWNPLNGVRLTVPRLHVEEVGFRCLWEDRLYTAPYRGTIFATGYDIYCSEESVVQYGVVTKIPTNTGLVWTWPYWLGLRIEDKSGLAAKHGITNLGGRVDSDYKWDDSGAEDGVIDERHFFEIGILQTSIIPGKVHIYKAGDKVAQLVLTKNIWGKDKGGMVRAGGFGSTGVR